MMYKELEKYKTGKTRPCDQVIHPDITTTFVYQESEYVAEFGSLLNDFIDHKNKPFWRKKSHHKHLTELYIKMLNKIEIIHWF